MASDADEIAYQARVILAAQMYIESLEKVPERISTCSWVRTP